MCVVLCVWVLGVCVELGVCWVVCRIYVLWCVHDGAVYVCFVYSCICMWSYVCGSIVEYICIVCIVCMCVDLCMNGVMCDVLLACTVHVCCVQMYVEAHLEQGFLTKPEVYKFG